MQVHFNHLLRSVKSSRPDSVIEILKNIQSTFDPDSVYETINTHLFGERKGTLIQYAIIQNLADTIPYFLQAGASWQNRDKRGFNSLDYACLFGHVDCANEILRYASESELLDVDPEKGFTCLHMAVSAERFQIIPPLLNKNIQLLDISTHRGSHPIAIAVDSGSNQSLKVLLEYALTHYGTPHLKHLLNSPPRPQESTDTLLHWAACDDNKQAIDILIKYGMDWEIRDEQNLNPLHSAILSGAPQAFSTLLNYLNSQQIRSFMMSPLESGDLPIHLAMKQTNPEIVKLLLDSGADCYVKNANDQTPIEVAILLNNTSSLAALLSSVSIPKSYLSKRFSSGLTGLHSAVAYDNPKTSAILLAHGADPLASSLLNETPFHIAAMNNSVNSIRLLIEHTKPAIQASVISDSSANPVNTIGSPFNTTALGLTAFNDGSPIVRDILLKAKADPCFGFSTGNSPIHIALAQGNSKALAEFLPLSPLSTLNSLYKIQTQERLIHTSLLFHAVALPSYLNPNRIVELLIQRGVDISYTLPDGSSVIHLAARLNRVKVLQVLARHPDFNPEIPMPISKETPLLSAASRGSFAAVSYLLHQYCNALAVDSSGNTCLHLLASNPFTATFQPLEMPDTELDCASLGYHPKIQSVLEKYGNSKLLGYNYLIVSFLARHVPEIFSIKNNFGKVAIETAKASKNRFYQDILHI